MNIRKRLKNLKSLFWSKKVPPLPWHCKPGKSIPKSALLEAMRSSLAQLPVSNSDVQMRGKIELGTSGSFKIVRTLASYIISRSGQGKWEKKRCFFTFRPMSPMQKFSRGIQGCHQKADVQGFLKMWCFLLLQFFKPKLWLVKVG